MTFASAGRCERTGRFGVAISTNPVAVDARCPFIAPNVGLVVTMATTDPRIAFRQICVIDHHPEPIAELRRIYDIHRPLLPYYCGRPGDPEAFGRENEWMEKQGKPCIL